MEKAEKIVISIAILLLATGILSNAFIPEEELKDYIDINGKKISTEEIFEKCELKELEAKNKSYYGTSFSCIIKIADIENPEGHNYAIVGSDGYKKTVSWDDMEKGILTKEKRAIFPHLPGAFWVQNVVKIEVI
ncbi:MAG: hypothetical protein H5T45_03515 [Thermoplasmatales archaeon]|nr:hypothetical protein [Thermoplasmatales archaeon]